ncbi:MAG: GNAT family N-acetyltransferase [Armatimonadota bacterium]|nr:GNAT family N-acetyltransferase [Armatimonadota bacterium]
MPEEFRAIRPDEFDECLNLWATVFERVGRNYFLPYFYGDPWFKLEYTRVCVVDGKLVSAVQICERLVSVGVADIVMGGIANVATLPEYRGKGYSSRLLKDSIRVMRRCGFDFSLLFTGIQPFYERLGWKSMPMPYLMGKLKQNIKPLEVRGYVVRQRTDDDFPGIQAVYQAYNNARPLTVRRPTNYWKGYVQPRFGQPDNTIVAERGGTIIGYVFSPSDKDTFRISEIGCLPGQEACFDLLITCAAARARDMGAQGLWCNVPQEPRILKALRRVSDDLQVREYHSGMYRLIDIRSLGARLMHELNLRVRNNMLSSGAISLDTEFGSLELTVSDSQVNLGAYDPMHVQISQEDLFSLIFGFKSVDELQIETTLEAHKIISTLFPKQKPVFWGPDHF